jgi:NAD+---dinitrogen-reductase ADP-D-ribosyltransferase
LQERLGDRRVRAPLSDFRTPRARGCSIGRQTSNVAPTSFNRCNLPPWVIASRRFDEDPRPIVIQGVREENRFLFDVLDRTPDPGERARRFDDWMDVRFQLHQWQAQATSGARRSLRNGYVRFLRGWGMDASSVEGAVLKGWVESRMGIAPTFHREPLGGRDGAAFGRYVADRTRGHARTSAIDAQLDLVYTFTQYELARRHPGERWLTLWRGQNDLAAHEVVEALGPREWVLRMNNLCSFTDDRERAWEFGDVVLEARVAIPRIFFAGHLLPRSILTGERELLVIGGELRLRRVLG